MLTLVNEILTRCVSRRIFCDGGLVDLLLEDGRLVVDVLDVGDDDRRRRLLGNARVLHDQVKGQTLLLQLLEVDG